MNIIIKVIYKNITGLFDCQIISSEREIKIWKNFSKEGTVPRNINDDTEKHVLCYTLKGSEFRKLFFNGFLIITYDRLAV